MFSDFHPELIDQVIEIDECLGLEFWLWLGEEGEVSCHRHKGDHRCCTIKLGVVLMERRRGIGEDNLMCGVSIRAEKEKAARQC